MKISKLTKSAAEEKDIKFIKGWIDGYGNTICVFEISGKKFGFIKIENEWFYFLGIGSSGATKEMPAGRGDYLIAQKIIGSDSNLFSLIAKKHSNEMLRLNNKTGAAWAPENESQKNNLAVLIDESAKINNYLSQSGILYSGDDKLIFGEDITGEDIRNILISKQTKKTTVRQSQKTQNVEQRYSGSSGAAKGNTIQVQTIIPAISAAFREEFGRELTVGSTYRDSYNQALAMRYPLRDGDYDRLYSHMGEKAERIKALISRGDQEGLLEAARIIEGTSLARGSHMAGRAIDIPFNPNRLSGSDYNKFSAMISRVSQQTGIKARLNKEKKSHFHIEVG